MTILKQILSKELHNTNIRYNKEENTCYSVQEDIIYLNRYDILKNKLLIRAIEKYLKQKLNKREHIIFALLHELGHRYYIGIKQKADINLYIRQQNKLRNKYFNLCPTIQEQINFKLEYWNTITEEYKAMKFAKRYFRIYKKLFSKKSLTY